MPKQAQRHLIDHHWQAQAGGDAAASSLDEEHEGERHDDHARDEPGGGLDRVVHVAVRGGEELVEHDEDHHAADHGEDHAEDEVGEDGLQRGEAQDAADGLGHAGEQRPAEGLPLVARGVVDGHGDAEPLGNVVDGDGDAQAEAHRGVGHGGEEGGEALGEVVDTDGQRRHGAHGGEPLLLCLIDLAVAVCSRHVHSDRVRAHVHLLVAPPLALGGGRRRRRRRRCEGLPRAVVVVASVGTLVAVRVAATLAGEAVRGAHVAVVDAITRAQPVHEDLEANADEHAEEEAGRGDRRRAALRDPVHVADGVERLGEDLDERDVEHDARRERERDAEHLVLRDRLEESREEHEGATETRGQARADGHDDGVGNVGRVPLRAESLVVLHPAPHMVSQLRHL
mmetsp:Transcript_23139/g.55063  ORF Transcript_23139/g.55063 Transcript_23139/m.55063 type:complete len:397 (-) Transcript_23139:36-1226(-)